MLERLSRILCLTILCAVTAHAQVVTAPPRPGIPVNPLVLDGIWESTTPGIDAIIVLAERSDGRLLGYMPGNPGTRLVGGRVEGRNVHFLVAGQDPLISWQAEFIGVVSGTSLIGTINDGTGSTPVQFQLTPDPVLEESWLLFESDTAERVILSRIEDGGGAFLFGEFLNLTACKFLACGGRITAWNISGLAHTINTSSDGGSSCSTTSTLVGNQDPVEFLLGGTYTTSDCTGVLGFGGFLGGKTGFTSMADVHALLESLAIFADDFEAEAPTAADLFHSAYLYNGLTRADVEAQFALWWAQYSSIRVGLSLDGIVMENDAEVHGYLSGPARMDLKLSAWGRDATTGAWEDFWKYETVIPDGGELALIGEEGGRTVIVGNAQAQPFSIGLPVSPSGHDNQVFGLWPYGVHGGGHPEGHPGLDFEYAVGAKVIASTAGPIVVIRQNTSHLPAILWSVVQEPRPGFKVIYDEVANLPPSIVVGTVLAEGDVVGDPYDKTTFRSNHLGVMVLGEHLCPSDYWHTTAQAQMDAFWPQCFFAEEPAEPRMHNPTQVTFPLTCRWELDTPGSGSSTAEVHFIRLDPTDWSFSYAFLDSGGSTLEWGAASFNMAVPWGTVTFTPDSSLGLSKRFGTYDIVEDVLTLDWDSAGFPADLSGASLYDLADD
jgi:hypothetical protein